MAVVLSVHSGVQNCGHLSALHVSPVTSASRPISNSDPYSVDDADVVIVLKTLLYAWMAPLMRVGGPFLGESSLFPKYKKPENLEREPGTLSNDASDIAFKIISDALYTTVAVECVAR